MSAPAQPAPARARWLMWGIPAAIFFIAFLHRVVPGIVAKDIMQAFGATGAIVGLLSSMYFYSYAGFMIPAGLLIDACGVRWTLAAGAAVMGAGAVAMGVAPGEALLFAGRFVVGLGATVTFIGALKIAASWFPPSQFATLAAVTATVGVLGSLAGTYPLAALVSAAGWRGAFWVLGVSTLALAALCALLVRDHPPGSPAAAEPARALGDILRGVLQVLRNPHTWPPFLAFFFAYAALGNQMLWIVPYLRDVYGLGIAQAALYASATSLALLVSGPLTGYLSDRVVRRRKLPYTALTALSVLVWIAFVGTLGALPLWGVFALLFAMGLAGGSFVLTWPLGREVNPPALAGIAVAVVNLGGFLGAALTQGPLGAVLDARWAGVTVAGARVYPLAAYHAAFAVCTGFMLAALLVTLALRETRGENIHHQLAGPRAGAGAPGLRILAGLAAALLALLPTTGHAQVPPTAAEKAAYTGLLAAAARGDAADIAARTARGESPGVRDARGRTPLHVAAYGGHVDAMRALVAAGADPNALEGDRYDIVTIAAVADDRPTLEAALALGASARNVTSRYDGTALIAAAHLGHAEVVRILIRAGAPLDHVNNLGWTALIESIVLGDGGARHTDTLRALVEAGAKVNLPDRGGQTPLALARARGYETMAGILRQAGAR